MIWDHGTWTPESPDVDAALAEGRSQVHARGQEAPRPWVLVRTRGRAGDVEAGLAPDQAPRRVGEHARTSRSWRRGRSSRTGCSIEIARDEGGDVEKAADGDPPALLRKILKDPKPARAAAQDVAKEVRLALARTQGRDLVKPAGGDRVPFRARPDARDARRRAVPPARAGSTRRSTTAIGSSPTRRASASRSSRATGRTAPSRSRTSRARSRRCRTATLLLDGEAVAFDKRLVSRFQLLQQGEAPVVFAVFDCLYRNGKDLRGEPLPRPARGPRGGDRGRRTGSSPRAGCASNGLKAFALARKKGFEGHGRARTRAAPYVEGRVDAMAQGQGPPGGGARHRRLHAARRHAAALRRAAARRVSREASCATSAASAPATRRRRSRRSTEDFRPLVRARRRPSSIRRAIKGADWLAPRLVAQVAFQEWTHDTRAAPAGLPRAARRQEAGRVPCCRRTRREPASKKTAARCPDVPLSISNPDKVFWPDEGYTKLDLCASTWRSSRRSSRTSRTGCCRSKRCPDGIAGDCFYQKEKPPGDAARHADAAHRSTRRATTNYVVGGKLETQLALANLGCIAVHVWNARKQAPRQPDWVCFDLDPGLGAVRRRGARGAEGQGGARRARARLVPEDVGQEGPARLRADPPGPRLRRRARVRRPARAIVSRRRSRRS